VIFAAEIDVVDESGDNRHDHDRIPSAERDSQRSVSRLKGRRGHLRQAIALRSTVAKEDKLGGETVFQPASLFPAQPGGT